MSATTASQLVSPPTGCVSMQPHCRLLCPAASKRDGSTHVTAAQPGAKTDL